MDRRRFSTIAHRHHLFCSPVSAEKVDQVLLLLGLRPGARALDVGCGKGEMLVRLAERYGAGGEGTDPNPDYIAVARAKAAARVPGSRLVFHDKPAVALDVPPASLDAALCVGASHAYGGYRDALGALARAVRPGGKVLLGEGFWRRAPHPDYLAVLGAMPGELTSHAGNVTAGVEFGLVAVATAVSSEDEWEHYEGLYARTVREHLEAHPNDPDAPDMRDRITRWREAFERWGRSTLGFGLYLFQRQ